MQMSRSFILRIGTDSFYANEVDSFIEWMVLDGFRWFSMEFSSKTGKYDDFWWYFEVKNGRGVVFDGFRWNFQVKNGKYDGFRWFSMVFWSKKMAEEWVLMVFDGFWWFLMVFDGIIEVKNGEKW